MGLDAYYRHKRKTFFLAHFKEFLLLLSTNRVRTAPYVELHHYKNTLVRYQCAILLPKIVGVQIWAKITIFSFLNKNISTFTL